MKKWALRVPAETAAPPIPTSSVALDTRPELPCQAQGLCRFHAAGPQWPLTDILPLCILCSGPVLGSPGQPPAPSGTSCSREEGQGGLRKLQGKSQTGQAEPGHCL